MHGTIFILSEKEIPVDTLFERVLEQAREFYYDSFDYVRKMKNRESEDEMLRFLKEAEKYAYVEGKRLSFSVRKLRDYCERKYDRPDCLKFSYSFHYCFESWVNMNKRALDPAILIDRNGIIFMGYCLLDALQWYLDCDGRRDIDEVYSFYLAGVLDYHM